MADEQLRLVAGLKDNASAGIRNIGKQLKTVRVEPGMAQAQKWVRSFNDDVATFRAQGARVGSILSSMGVGGLAAGASIAGLVGQFKQLAEHTLDMKELAREIGVTTTELRAMEKAGQHFGLDPSKMDAALKKIAGYMPMVTRSINNPLSEQLAKYPELLAKIKGEAGDTVAVLRDYMGHVNQLAKPQDRIKLFEEVLGDGELEKLNAEGTGGFQAQLDAARKSIEPITKEAEAQAQALREAIIDFNSSINRLELKVAPAVFAGLKASADDFRQAFGVIEKAYDWIEKNKDHPIQAAQDQALGAIDAQAAHNKEHPEGVVVDAPGLLSQFIHWSNDLAQRALTGGVAPDSRPMTLRAPVPKPTAPAASAVHPDDDRLSRARASDADGWKQQQDYGRGLLQQFGSLDQPVLHLVGTLKTAAAQAETDRIKPASFHPNGLLAPAAGNDPASIIEVGTKAGVLAAFRELQGLSGADGSTARGGIMPASFAGGGRGAGGGRAPSIRFGRQHSSAPYDDGGATPTGAHDPLKDLIAAHETGGTGAAGYDTVYGHAERGGPLAPPKPLTQMTIAEVLAYQRAMKPRAGSAAFPVGRAQWTESTLRGLTRSMDQNQPFNADLQEKLFDRSIAGRMGQGPGGFRSEWASLGGMSDAEIGQAMQGHRDALKNAAPTASASGSKGAYPDWMDDKSKREMAGINAPLARELLAASEATGTHFSILQGMRTEAEAAHNAFTGRGVVNSQHRWGAAADIKLTDAQGHALDRAGYANFAQAFQSYSHSHGGNSRWLGGIGGRWSSDIAHFDQGLGYGQSHARDPYGVGGPTASDIAAGNKEIFSGPDNPFLRAAKPLGDAAIQLRAAADQQRTAAMARRDSLNTRPDLMNPPALDLDAEKRKRMLRDQQVGKVEGGIDAHWD